MNRTVLEDQAKFFWLRSGKGLRSIRELADTLPTVLDDEYAYHVRSGNNDFANWLDHVFGERELAERMRRCSTRADLQTLLYNTIIQAELRRKTQGRAVRVQGQEPEEPSPPPPLISPLLPPKLQPEPPAVLRPRDVFQKSTLASRPPSTTDEFFDIPPDDLRDKPEVFAKYRENDSKRKDALADRFDAVARRFQENCKPETPREMQRRFDMLFDRYRELRGRLSEARKQGKDPFIAELLVRPLTSKLEYARVTGQERDFLIVEQLLQEAEGALAQAKAEQPVDVRREIATLVGGGS